MSVINEVIINNEGSRPVVVEFQNGKIKPGEEYNLKSGVFKTKDNKTLVGIGNNNMVYAGIINNETELYNNFMLIHDKKTGKVRLIQIDYCTVNPVLNRTTELLPSVKDVENSVSELNKQFGSKKTRKYTEQQERLKMNISTVKDQLEKTVSDIQMDTSDLHYPVSNENDSLYRPKINRDASTVEQVYNIDDLVPKHILDTLNNAAVNIIDGNIEEYSLIPFASINIARILQTSDERTSFKIKIFLYINYLIKFINTPMKQITRKFVACDISSEVSAHILDNYSVNTGHVRTRPLLMKDKALCFILVLASIAMDYELDVEQLSKDLKTGIKKVMEISRILAFSSSSKSKTVIILKIPLPAPVSSSPKRKRK